MWTVVGMFHHLSADNTYNIIDETRPDLMSSRGGYTQPRSLLRAGMSAGRASEAAVSMVSVMMPAQHAAMSQVALSLPCCIACQSLMAECLKRAQTLCVAG